MGQYPEVALALPGRIGPRPQRRPQQPLVPAEGALHLPPLPVLAPVEPAAHLPAVLTPRPLPAPAPAVDRDDGGADGVIDATEFVVAFGVVGGVRQDAVPADLRHLVDEVGEQGGLVGRADADLGGGDEVALRVAGDRQQDVPPHAVALALAAGVVGRGVAAVQAGAVDGGLGALADQAAQAGAAQGLPLEPADPPFLRSRRSA
jgi:hypothetical protein